LISLPYTLTGKTPLARGFHPVPFTRCLLRRGHLPDARDVARYRVLLDLKETFLPALDGLALQAKDVAGISVLQLNLDCSWQRSQRFLDPREDAAVPRFAVTARPTVLDHEAKVFYPRPANERADRSALAYEDASRTLQTLSLPTCGSART